MTNIQIFGTGDAKMKSLRENLAIAMKEAAVTGEVEEVSEYNRIYATGVTEMPALAVDGEIVFEGGVPTIDDLKRILGTHRPHHGKLERLKRILVAVDMSQISESALLCAYRIAHDFDARLDVVYVMDSIFEGSTPSPSGFLSNYKNTMQEEVETFVRETLQRDATLVPPTVVGEGAPGVHDARTVFVRIGFGLPEEALIHMSDETDLLVLGTTGRGSLTRKLFGSVSMSVSKNAHCPVMLVPPMSVFKSFHNILYASNFESLTAQAIQQTVSFARRFKGQLHFVHVGPPGEKGLELERKLFEINYRYADPEMPFIFSKVVGEDVVESLHEYGYQCRIDLMVFVTHHRSFWSDLMHHSISRDILLHTGTPVLVIHSGEDQAADA